MTIYDAMEALHQGKKIKLPEWKGYWAKEHGRLKIYDSQEAIEQYKLRDDWQVIENDQSEICL